MQLRRIGGPLLAAAMFVFALWVLRRELRHYGYREIIGASHAIPLDRILLATLFTALGYLVLTAYDYLGLRYAGRVLPYRKVALASFSGYAFSQSLGLPAVTGGSIRLRLYSAWGLSTIDVTKVVAFNSLSFFVSVITVGGAVFLIEPLRVPAILHLPFATIRPLGAVFLALVATYLILCVREHEPLRIRGHEISFPSPRLALGQMLAGTLDWLVAGAVLFTLMPRGTGLSYPLFLAIFVLSQTAGLASHIPGGLGVFETLVLALLPPSVPAAAALGALLAYRVIFYLMPFGVAVVLLGVREARERREGIARATRFAGRSISVVAPHLLAGMTFVSGAILLFSGATPAMPARLRWLDDVLPLGLLEASHFLGSIVGTALLILAWGLARRLDAAYHLAVWLHAAGNASSLVKGLDYEEAIALAVALTALVPARREFDRKASLLAEPLTPGWIASVVAVVVASLWVGFFAYKHLDYSSDLWWRFALRGDGPRFLRASAGAVGAAFVFGALRLLRPAPPPSLVTTADQLDRAAAIVARSRDTNANLALLGDKSLLFSDSGDAFVMYAVEGRSWIAMGDPVGPPDSVEELAWTFAELAHRYDDVGVFYQVKPQNLRLYIDLGFLLLKLGEEARVPLAQFAPEGSLRRAVRRLDREGVSCEIVPSEGVPALLPRLREVSDAWLATRNTREKGFSLGYFDERYLARFPIAVVRTGETIVSFANVWTGADREEVSVDLMRHVPEAPNGTMDYLFAKLMMWGREQGYAWFNLGMAPLTGLESRPLAPLWNRVGTFLYRHGEHFYNFQGLRQYKEKFHPVWEPRYLASPGGLALPRVFANLASLISGGLAGVVRR
jgi:phosphatidylglycerol lysyltransferase